MPSLAALVPRPPYPALLAVLFNGLLLVFAASALAAPPLPHSEDSSRDCVGCHAAVRPLPASHKAYGNETCQACHQSSGAPPAPAAVAPGNAANGTSCLGCHQNRGLSMRLSSGEDLALYVDENVLSKSVHGGRLACTDCHVSITGYPHPKVPYADHRGFTTAYYETCKRCHFANYTKTLDSVHFAALSAGERDAPVCADCHGSHDVAKPAAPRSSTSQACGTCHAQINTRYVASVHGKALVDDENPDVPACTTCHGVHNIAGASSASFRLASTGLCARCHEDATLMGKYGLSSDVLKTYLEDFHGRTVGFYQMERSGALPTEPLCIDCHGIHDIKSASDPDSPVIRANLQATCQKCHADANPNFPSAWLAHYEPSREKAPLVYYIRVYYWLLIPMMIGGLGLHIGLDLWRLARNR